MRHDELITFTASCCSHRLFSATRVWLTALRRDLGGLERQSSQSCLPQQERSVFTRVDALSLQLRARLQTSHKPTSRARTRHKDSPHRRSITVPRTFDPQSARLDLHTNTSTLLHFPRLPIAPSHSQSALLRRSDLFQSRHPLLHTTSTRIRSGNRIGCTSSPFRDGGTYSFALLLFDRLLLSNLKPLRAARLPEQRDLSSSFPVFNLTSPHLLSLSAPHWL